MVPWKLVSFFFPQALMFPKTKYSRENKTNCFPRSHTLCIITYSQLLYLEKGLGF